MSPVVGFLTYALAVVLVGSLVVLTGASNAWMALLIIPVPALVIWKPTRIHWPMALLLFGAYWVVNAANHLSDLAANLRSSGVAILTMLVVCEILYATGRARLRAEAALVATNEQLAQAVLRANEMAAVAQEADQIKSDFLASTSHELRTPLTGIIGSLDLVLAGQCEDRDEERRFVQIAHDSSQKLLGVVNAVLDIARIEAGKVEVELAPVDVVDIAGEVCDLYRFPAADRGLTLALEQPLSAHPVVMADADKVRQILLNLVGNAIKFTEHGGVIVTLEPAPDRAALAIHVRDTGIGIATDKQGRLFQPFVQADRDVARRFGGTGLGLSISRRLAERMGGSVSLFSAGEGQGATFTLTLPLAATGAVEPPRSTPALLLAG
ncbi:MAG: hypothetical protein JNL73_18200 [Anaerolineales bacterium]|nr:hypothetical protein [Anaerolineales bacterium]